MSEAEEVEEFKPRGALAFTLLFAFVLLLLWFIMYIIFLARGFIYG